MEAMNYRQGPAKYQRWLIVAGILVAAGLGSTLFRVWFVSQFALDKKPQFDLTYHEQVATPEQWDPGPNPDQLKESDWFEDVTKRSGVRHTYQNGRAGHYYILESVGGGVAMLDYDLDGDLDLYFTGGGTISAVPKSNAIHGVAGKLFRNDGGMRFTDVTKGSGLDVPGDYSHGASVADYDNDGDPDLFVSCYGRSRLFENVRGKFRDVTKTSGLSVTGWATASAWGDFDNDGHTDLFIVRYLDWTPGVSTKCKHVGDQRDICGPEKFSGQSDLLFRNLGNGKFVKESNLAVRDKGKGLGVVVADFNLDGYLDAYVANDETANHLYLGSQQGLQERGAQSGVAMSTNGAPQGGMGVDVGDVNGDGRLDLWVVNFEAEDNALYIQSSLGMFESVADRLGLAAPSRRYVGFGTALGDFNHDGQLDVLIANGHVFYHGRYSTFDQPPQLLTRRRGNERFANVSLRGGTYFRQRHPARGVAVGDLDNDGAEDIVVVHQNKPSVILRNRNRPAKYVRLRLVGKGAKDPVGAVVLAADKRGAFIRCVRSGASYLSSGDPRILLPGEVAAVEVRWPRGGRERFRLQQNATTRVVQGMGQPIKAE